MDFINKKFKNRVTGDEFTIIDQYQNIAITSNKEKINTSLLQNDKLFSEVSSLSTIRTINESSKNDLIDPSRFFDSQTTYNAFAEKIKTFDTSKIRDDDSDQVNVNNLKRDLPTVNYSNMTSTNESAVIMSDPEDEIEELKRKYGATTIDDSLKKQNETFARILDPQVDTNVQVENNINPVIMNEPNTQRREVYQEQSISQSIDPVTSMFRNVKRNLDFKINLKIDGKIPRLDFIEMMEDSYEISIIDFLAEEFTNKLLSDPSIIRNRVKEEINNMIHKKLHVKSTDSHPNTENEEVKPELPKVPKVTKRTAKKTSKNEETE
jgi:hypothetical protein